MLFVESGMRVHSGLDYLLLPKVVQKLKRKDDIGRFVCGSSGDGDCLC